METVPANASLIVVNVFTPKSGKLEDFLAAQNAGLSRLRGKIPGLRGGRLYRAEDGSRALLVSAFDTQAQLERWLASAEFAEHRANVTPFVERTEATRFRLVYEAGSL